MRRRIGFAGALSLCLLATVLARGEALNVVAYGADPTGVRNSTHAIQSAIDHGCDEVRRTASASEVYFPSGTYLVSLSSQDPKGYTDGRPNNPYHTGSIVIPCAHIHLRGAGAGKSTLRQTYRDARGATVDPDTSCLPVDTLGKINRGSLLYSESNQDLRIEDLTLDVGRHRYAGWQGNGVDYIDYAIPAASLSPMQCGSMWDTTNRGLVLNLIAANDMHLDRIEIENCGGECVYGGFPGGQRENSITHSNLHHSSGDLWSVFGRWRIENNTMDDCAANGIENNSLEDQLILNNKVSRCMLGITIAPMPAGTMYFRMTRLESDASSLSFELAAKDMPGVDVFDGKTTFGIQYGYCPPRGTGRAQDAGMALNREATDSYRVKTHRCDKEHACSFTAALASSDQANRSCTDLASKSGSASDHTPYMVVQAKQKASHYRIEGNTLVDDFEYGLYLEGNNILAQDNTFIDSGWAGIPLLQYSSDGSRALPGGLSTCTIRTGQYVRLKAAETIGALDGNLSSGGNERNPWNVSSVRILSIDDLHETMTFACAIPQRIGLKPSQLGMLRDGHPRGAIGLANNTVGYPGTRVWNIEIAHNRIVTDRYRPGPAIAYVLGDDQHASDLYIHDNIASRTTAAESAGLASAEISGCPVTPVEHYIANLRLEGMGKGQLSGQRSACEPRKP